MKSFLVWLIGLIALGGAGFAGLNHYNETNLEHAYKMELNELKNSFERQSNGLQLLDSEGYTKEIGIHLERYFRELRKLGKEYPEYQNFERELALGAEKVEKGHMSPANKMARDEQINLTLELMNKMRQGHYRPIFTDAKNGFRFDIYDISPQAADGQSFIKVSYAHWGAFGPVNYGMIEGTFSVEQEAGKAVEIPQIVAESQPPTLQVKGERWVTEFIPGVEIGYYLLPRFPKQALGINLKFQYSIRTVGGTSIPVDIEFPEIKIADAWKIDGDKEWKAQERFASDEELEALGAKPQVTVK
ncbi:MAG: hypothetical protein VX834_11910 [Myxococcota bacterium]|nr:hypothetical protein [Myxococcota bacterium]